MWSAVAFYLIADHCHALNNSFTFKVVKHEMLGASVIPDANGARLPMIAHSKAGIADPPGQITQYRFAFSRVHFHDSAREVFVNVKYLLTCFGVHTNYRVNGHFFGTVVRQRVMQCC